MSPYSLVVCQHQGGHWRAEGFDLIAVSRFLKFFFKQPLALAAPSPALGQLGCPAVSLQGPAPRAALCPGTPTISSSSSSSSCPLLLLFLFFLFPKHSTVSWLSARDPAAWQCLRSHRVFSEISGDDLLQYHIIYFIWEVLVHYSAAVFWGFPLPCVQGLFG